MNQIINFTFFLIFLTDADADLTEGADLGFNTGGVKGQNFERTLKKHQKR